MPWHRKHECRIYQIYSRNNTQDNRWCIEEKCWNRWLSRNLERRYSYTSTTTFKQNQERGEQNEQFKAGSHVAISLESFCNMRNRTNKGKIKKSYTKRLSSLPKRKKRNRTSYVYETPDKKSNYILIKITSKLQPHYNDEEHDRSIP